MLQQVKRAARALLGPDECEEQEALDRLCLKYEHEALFAATGGFDADLRLGAGAAGTVYRGVVRGGTEVAVKVLKASPNVACSFADEVRVLSRFRHPNLVTLMGWGQSAVDAGTKYLVYELLPGGDVARRLQRSQTHEEPFGWQHRIGVAVDAARGLSHMVNSQPKAFHRDIKPPNILLDANGRAKMADFGLSAVVKNVGQGHLTVERISGTPGYADPDYLATGKVTEQSEVYSFGTLLLELLMNERPALIGPKGELVFPVVQLVQPVAPGAQERIAGRLDPQARWPEAVVGGVARLALRCVAARAEARPSFEQIVSALRRCMEFEDGQLAAPAAAPAPGLAKVPDSRRLPNWGEGPLPVPEHVRAAGDPAADNPDLHADALEDSVADAFDDSPIKLPNLLGSGKRMVCPVGGGEMCSKGAQALRDGLSAPPYVKAPPDALPTPLRAAAEDGVAELILECVQAEGVDLAAVPRGERTLHFVVPADGEPFVATVGRQQQDKFFERLVPRPDHLLRISRAHFELRLPGGPREGPVLRRLSGNPLLFGGRALAPEDAVPVRQGGYISFSGAKGGDAPFLVLRLTCHPRGEGRGEGRGRGRRAADGESAAACPRAPPLDAERPAASLVCSFALGQRSMLSSIGLGSRAIPIPRDGILDVGRQHQIGFFERLLKAEPAWLPYISRTHCRVSLIGSAGADLRVESRSANVVRVNGRHLSKGQTAVITGGGYIALVARRELEQAGTYGPETEFLRLSFHTKAAGDANATA